MKKATDKNKQGLSGKYYFHSLHKNVGAYIREPGAVSGFRSQFYLVYNNGDWFITDNDKNNCFLWLYLYCNSGYFHLETKGMYFTVCKRLL